MRERLKSSRPNCGRDLGNRFEQLESPLLLHACPRGGMDIQRLSVLDLSQPTENCTLEDGTVERKDVVPTWSE
jgi:hypothetical protein